MTYLEQLEEKEKSLNIKKNELKSLKKEIKLLKSLNKLNPSSSNIGRVKTPVKKIINKTINLDNTSRCKIQDIINNNYVNIEYIKANNEKRKFLNVSFDPKRSMAYFEKFPKKTTNIKNDFSKVNLLEEDDFGDDQFKNIFFEKITKITIIKTIK